MEHGDVGMTEKGDAHILAPQVIVTVCKALCTIFIYLMPWGTIPDRDDIPPECHFYTTLGAAWLEPGSYIHGIQIGDVGMPVCCMDEAKKVRFLGKVAAGPNYFDCNDPGVPTS
jgi:hypothetical protein